MDVLKDQSSKQSKPTGHLNFGQKPLEKNQLMYYGYNSRMIPDDLHSKPVYRRLIERSAEEQAEIKVMKAKSMKVKKRQS